MSDLLLKAVTIKNWMTFEEAHIEFPHSGLVLVKGLNMAGEGRMESVGAGKTAIGEAICCTLFGLKGRMARLTNCVRGANTTSNVPRHEPLYVAVKAELRGKPLLVELGFKHPDLSRTGEGLRYTYAGVPIMRGHINDTRAELARAINVTPELAPWTVFLDADKIWLSRVPEHERVSLLMEAMAQPWADYFERSKVVLAQFKKAAEEADIGHQHATKIYHATELQLAAAKADLEKAKLDYAGLLKAQKVAIEAEHKTLIEINNAVSVKKYELEKAQQRLKLAQAKLIQLNQELDQVKKETQEAIQLAYEQALSGWKERIIQERVALEKITTSLTVKQHELSSIRKRLKELEDKQAETYHQLELQQRELQDRIQEAQEARMMVATDKASAKAAYDQAKANVEEITGQGKLCPTCNQPWKSEASADEKLARWKKFNYAKEKFELAENMLKRATDLLDELKSQHQGVTTKLRATRVNATVKELSDSYERIDADLPTLEERRQHQQVKLNLAEQPPVRPSTPSAQQQKKVNKIIEDIEEATALAITAATYTEATEGELRRLEEKAQRQEQNILAAKRPPDSTFLEQAKTILVERTKRAFEAETELRLAANSMAETREAVKVVQYWNVAFSPAGIPNMVLQDIIKPLNLTSRRLSSIMTGGTMEITYSTQRMLATNVERPELSIKVKNKSGACNVEGSSKGEARLVNLIVVETLAEIGQVASRVNFRWYDEVLTSQDRVGRRTILNYLQELAHRLDILVFVVDHSVEAESYSDHVLLVEKSTAGTTTARWAR